MYLCSTRVANDVHVSDMILHLYDYSRWSGLRLIDLINILRTFISLTAVNLAKLRYRIRNETWAHGDTHLMLAAIDLSARHCPTLARIMRQTVMFWKRRNIVTPYFVSGSCSGAPPVLTDRNRITRRKPLLRLIFLRKSVAVPVIT